MLKAVDVLRTMPATLAGLADRWLSWSQALAVTKAARRVPVARRPALDGLVASAMVAHRDWEPDALVADVWAWVDGQQPSRLERAEAAARRGRFVALSPRLFGGVGRSSGSWTRWGSPPWPRRWTPCWGRRPPCWTTWPTTTRWTRRSTGWMPSGGR